MSFWQWLSPRWSFCCYIFQILRVIQVAFSLSHCVKSVQIPSFFWSVFSRIRTEYGDLRCKSPYSVRIRANTYQKKLHIWTLFTQCPQMILIVSCFHSIILFCAKSLIQEKLNLWRKLGFLLFFLFYGVLIIRKL